MIKTSIEKMARDIGFDIGNSDDVVQSDLLNGFCDALSKLNSHDLQMQLTYIADKLNTNSVSVLKELNNFL